MPVRLIKIHGRKKWQARVAFLGLRTSRICESKAEGRQAEANLLQELKARAGQAEAEESRPATLRQLFEFYAVDLLDRGKPDASAERVECTARAFESVVPEFLDRPISAIGDAEIFEFRNARQRRGTKPASINRDLRVIRAALKKVRPEYRFPRGAFSKEDETRVRWLRPEEELLVFEPMPSPFREIAKVAALTLMRLSEIRLLHREHVHLEQGVVLLPQAKAGARPVILSEAARAILMQQLNANPQSNWVFPGPDGRPYSRQHVGRVFRKAARGAGLKDFHFHDLRHHGATMALNKGFTAPIVMALGGWRSEAMMRRYAAVTDQTLRAAAEAVSGNGSWQRQANHAPVKV